MVSTSEAPSVILATKLAGEECADFGAGLPQPWTELLPGGQIFAALILCTSFSEKYQGRLMQPGERADVRLPAADGVMAQTWHPTLLHRAGHQEAVAYTWLGDEAAGDRTIYVAFAPMRRKRQFFKIVGSCTGLGDLVCEPLGAEGDRQSVLIAPYIQRKLAKVWGGCGLMEQLSKYVAAYPQHRILFSGISHGATLAQAAALQFQCAQPLADVHAATWNAFKWTDSAGSSLVQQVLGKRLLPFVLSRADRWDSVAGFPACCAAMRNLVLLDADSGSFQQRASTVSFPGESNPANIAHWRRALELHFASAVIKAMKQAMKLALETEVHLIDFPVDKLFLTSSLGED
ncbi:unnamed protein product, partial [Polarella glacialis]